MASSGALVAAGRTWATGTVAAVPPLPAQELAITGAEAGTPVRGLAVVGLAGVVAVIAARGWLRPVVGVLLLLAGVGIVAASLAFDPGASLFAASPPGPGPRAVEDGGATLWPALSAGCGAGLALAGVLVVVGGRRGGGLSPKYDSPVAGPGVAPGSSLPSVEAGAPDPTATERALWEALDRGEDPTARERAAVDPDRAPGPPPTDEGDLAQG